MRVSENSRHPFFLEVGLEIKVQDRCKPPNSSLNQKFNLLIYIRNSEKHWNQC